MARQAKVVDVEPVGRRSGCRRLVLLLLLLMAAAAAVWYFLLRPPQTASPRRVVHATNVRSNIVQEGGSLDLLPIAGAAVADHEKLHRVFAYRGQRRKSRRRGWFLLIGRRRLARDDESQQEQ